MQNERVLPASHTLVFRAHTPVALTLFVAAVVVVAFFHSQLATLGHLLHSLNP